MEEIKLDSNRAVRIIAPILLRDYLLDQDDFISACKETDSAILNYEKNIIDESNNFDISKISKDLALFKHMLDTAWAFNDDISIDEKNFDTLDSDRRLYKTAQVEKLLNVDLVQDNEAISRTSETYP